MAFQVEVIADFPDRLRKLERDSRDKPTGAGPES